MVQAHGSFGTLRQLLKQSIELLKMYVVIVLSSVIGHIGSLRFLTANSSKVASQTN